MAVCAGRDIPIVNTEMFGVPVQEYFDCGAKTSIASAKLKKMMQFKGCHFETVRCQATLADGLSSIRDFLTTKCKILIGGRYFKIKFLVFPGCENNRTLLGNDFLEEAEIVIRMGQRPWHFEDNPQQIFHFEDELPISLNLIETVQVSKQLPQPSK